MADVVASYAQVDAPKIYGKGDKKKLSYSKPIQFHEENSQMVDNKGSLRSSSMAISRPPSLKRASVTQLNSLPSSPSSPHRTPSSKPLLKSQSLPIIKITDFDLGIEEYITDDSRYQYTYLTDSPYGIDELKDEGDIQDNFSDSFDEDSDGSRISPEPREVDRAYSPTIFKRTSKKAPSEEFRRVDGNSRIPGRVEADVETEDDDVFLSDREFEREIEVVSETEDDFVLKYPSILRRPSSTPNHSGSKNKSIKGKKLKSRSARRKSLNDIDKLKRTKKVIFKNDIFEVMNKKVNKVVLKPIEKVKKKKKKPKPKSKNGSEYLISGPQSEDLYHPNARPLSLPPLQASTNRGTARRTRKKGNLYPYIHGLQRTIDSRPSSAKSSRMPNSASTNRSKDDSRIQYEAATFEEQLPPKSAIKVVPEPWMVRRVRIFRNGDRYFPGLEYAFKIGRDVLNLEGLCNKISDRIGLPRGTRYIFGLDGTRKYRLEELEDGGSYVASSDRRFANLAYNKNRPRWNSKHKVDNINTGRTGTPLVRIAGKSRGDSRDSSDSGNSTGSSNGKQNSREGRTIKVINTEDRSQEISVLVNMKTVQSWEDVVGDLGQVLKMRGDLRLFTINGQEVKSFSQFKNDYAALDSFFLKPIDDTKRTSQSRPSSALTDGTITPRKVNKDEEKRSKSRARTGRQTKSNLRKYASEPSLKEAVDESEQLEVSDGRAVSINIQGQKRIVHPPRQVVTHNPNPPSYTLSLDWVYGYRGADVKKNMWVVSTEELLYFVAAIAVLYDRKLDTQRHYTEHTEDIQCMALHPTRDIAASGQRSTRGARMTAHVRVWSVRSLNTLHVLGERELGLGVMALAFSQKNKGQYLLAVDADAEHLLTVWTWETEKLFGKVAVRLY